MDKIISWADGKYRCTEIFKGEFAEYQCILDKDHKGNHEGRASVSWQSKPKVIIIDNNPVSIASYMEEHPGVLD